MKLCEVRLDLADSSNDDTLTSIHTSDALYAPKLYLDCFNVTSSLNRGDMPKLENSTAEDINSDPDFDNRFWHSRYGFFAWNGNPVGRDEGQDCGWADGCEDG